jgi:predicted  nucleic acid-binding Zn-ribbon protein
MANRLNINIGEKVRQCTQCGTYYSNHLSTCPHCGGSKYNVKELTPEIEREIGS